MNFFFKDYVFNTKQKTLFHNDTEVAAEPRTLEVLEYLILNKDKYVQLNELHDSVWTGRVVSDTAVRNTIKKLRIVLNDNDIEQPQFVKSAHKRGYKFICPVVESTSQESGIIEAFEQSGGTSQHLLVEAPYTFNKPRMMFLIFLMLSIVISIVMWTGSALNLKQELSIERESISKLPGEKFGIDINSDRSLIAFAGKVGEQQDSQVYIFNTFSKELNQLTTDAQLAADATFISDKLIIFNDSIVGEASLSLIQLDEHNQTKKIQTLIANKQMIGRVIKGRSDNEIIFPLLDEQYPNVMIYSYNLTSGELKRVTSKRYSDSHDYLAAYDPETGLFAVASLHGNSEVLSFRSYETQNEFLTLQMDTQTINMVWHDKYLFVLNKHGIIKIDSSTGQIDTVLESYNRQINDFSLSADGKSIYVIEDDIEKGATYFTQRVFDERLNIAKIIEPTSNIRQLAPLNSEGKFAAIEKQNNTYAFCVYDAHNNKLTYPVKIQSQRPITIIQTHQSKDVVLLKSEEKILMVNVGTSEIIQLSSNEQFVSDATFDSTGDYILLGENISGIWEIHQISITNAQEGRSVGMNGFKSVRENSLYTVAMDELNNIYLRTENVNEFTPLEINIKQYKQWFLLENKIIWTSTNYHKTFLNIYDIDSKELIVKDYKYNEFNPNFSVQATGNITSLYTKSSSSRESEISKIKFE